VVRCIDEMVSALWQSYILQWPCCTYTPLSLRRYAYLCLFIFPNPMPSLSYLGPQTSHVCSPSDIPTYYWCAWGWGVSLDDCHKYLYYELLIILSQGWMGMVSTAFHFISSIFLPKIIQFYLYNALVEKVHHHTSTKNLYDMYTLLQVPLNKNLIRP
jgi:hypothetical protein